MDRDGSGAPRVSLDPPKETGQGRTLRQEIKRIDAALRTHDRTVLAGYGGFNTAVKKVAETRESPKKYESRKGSRLIDLLGRGVPALLPPPEETG